MANICTWTGATDGDWTKTANWLEGDVPDTGDTVNIGKNPLGTADVSIDTNLDQSAVTVAELNIDAGYTGAIGTVGASSAYLKIGATICRIGENYGPGVKNHSGRIKIDFSNVQTTCTVYGTKGSATETALPPVRLKGTHASNKLFVRGGSVGVACESGEVATFLWISCGADNTDGTPDVFIGSGVTLTNLYSYRGEVLCLSGWSGILYLHGGTVTTEGSLTVGSVSAYGGVFVPNSSGTITLIQANNALIDCSGSNAPRTITDIEIGKGVTFRYDPNVVTITNGPTLVDRCTISTAAV